MSRCYLAVALLLLACENGGGGSALRVELVRADGVNAATGVANGTLSVAVEQEGTPLCSAADCTARITAEQFDLPLPFESLTALTRIHAAISLEPDPAPVRLGAFPPFSPFGEQLDTGELPLRLVMEAPSTCVSLTLPPASSAASFPVLTTPRRDAAVAIRRNIALIAGGVSAAGDVGDVETFDQIVADVRPPLPSVTALGRARGLTLSEDVSLVLGHQAFLFVVSGGPAAATGADLHDGASFASTTLALESGGVVIGGDATDGVTWLSPSGSATSGRLATPRAFAAAASMSGGVLVVGGGDPVAEWLTQSGAAALDALTLPEGEYAGGWLVPSADGDAALYVGFSVDGVPSERTFVITGCPETCVVTGGPTWDARPDASAVLTAAGTLWIVGGEGSSAIDLARWDGSSAIIEPRSPLTRPRAGAIVFEHASGIVTVAGGEDEDGALLSDLEHCTPERLDPL